MPQYLSFPSFTDERGSLTVLEKAIPFPIARVYYIYNTNHLPRGGHKHKKTKQVLVCIQGSCLIRVKQNKEITDYSLNTPSEGLLLEPEEWHEILFSSSSVLLVLASTPYQPDDYVYDLL